MTGGISPGTGFLFAHSQLVEQIEPIPVVIPVVRGIGNACMHVKYTPGEKSEHGNALVTN